MSLEQWKKLGLQIATQQHTFSLCFPASIAFYVTEGYNLPPLFLSLSEASQIVFKHHFHGERGLKSPPLHLFVWFKGVLLNRHISLRGWWDKKSFPHYLCPIQVKILFNRHILRRGRGLKMMFVTSPNACLIQSLRFFKFVTGVWYTRIFTYPHKKKSKGYV